MVDPFAHPDDSLTRAILARTSGAPCARLRELACDLVDGAMAPDLQAMALGHLEHCAGCAALVAALREASALLPDLAERDPGPAFTARVMATTSRRPLPLARPGAWTRIMGRPRIALELAYLGVAASLILFQLSASGLGQDWRTPAMVRPLSASVRSVAAAEVRTARSFGHAMPERVRGLPVWHRAYARVRGWFSHAAEPANL